MSACSHLVPRVRGVRQAGVLIAALAGALALTACGGGQRQDVAEHSGNYTVQVLSATFPAAQTLSQHTQMHIQVKNVSGKAIPNLAITVCNVTCAYPAPPGQGSSSAAFASNLSENDLANPSRPIWVVDRAPGSCKGASGYSCQAGGGGGDTSAYTNTWVYGRLPNGATATFDWKVTAVTTGQHTLAWVIDAGLNDKAKAVVNGGGAPHGTFTVNVTGKPAQAYVDNNGQIVTTQQP